jgi:hypothetical protein
MTVSEILVIVLVSVVCGSIGGLLRAKLHRWVTISRE